jgi:hypothetical protein
MKPYLVFSIILIFAFALIFFLRPNQDEHQVVIPVKIGDNIKENAYLDFLGEIVDPSKKEEKYVVAILDNVCSSCMSGQILFRLERLQRERKDIQSFIILPNKYTANDLSNIKNNYNLKLNLKPMSEKLEDLIQSKRKSLIRKGIIGSIFLIDSNSEVNFIHLIKVGDSIEEIITSVTDNLT